MLRNDTCLFLQKPQPVLQGSGLIVPTTHRGTVFDLTGTEWADTFFLLQEVKRLLDANYQPENQRNLKD